MSEEQIPAPITGPDLPRYRCHKIVRAAKIIELSSGAHDGYRLHFESGNFVTVGPEWLESRCRGEDPSGGYYVLYDGDNYTSWSPAKAFEEGYRLVDKNEENGSFEKDLRHIINKWSMEGMSNTPDYILAEYLHLCLHNLNGLMLNREAHLGRRKPSSDAPPLS